MTVRKVDYVFLNDETGELTFRANGGPALVLPVTGMVTAKAKVGFFVNPDLPGRYVVKGLGFKPMVLEFFVSKNDGLRTWFCDCHGFADDEGNQNVSAWTGNYSNMFRGDMKTDRCLYAFNASGIVQVEATLVSMDEDGFTLDFTVCGNEGFSIRWKALGSITRAYLLK